MLRGRVFALAFLAAAGAAPAVAQSDTARAVPPSPADSVFAQARQLVSNGNGAAGRVLVDSMIAATMPGTSAYAEALYWRATLAASSDDAEQDYRRLVVEYPLSSRTGDALLELAHLEAARGDRGPAITHLERFLLENPRSEERGRATLLLVRLGFEDDRPQVACTFLGRILREIPESDVELRNQLTYYSPRCNRVDTTRAPATTQPAERGAGNDASASRANHGRFTLQVAAYDTRSAADRLVKRLRDRGLDARAVGTAKPFRVRVGHYATRAAAARAARGLHAKKIDAYVTEAGADDR